VPGGQWTTLWVGAGKRIGMRPGDLVGAITNEAGVPASAIGAIQITDGFALVDVAAGQANDILQALSAATIRGRRLPVRIER
jgi:ATP-dependent RNA helicase DeaD